MSRALYQGAEKRLVRFDGTRVPSHLRTGPSHSTSAPSHHRTVAPYVPLISLEIASHSKIRQIGASVEATPAPVHAIVAGVSVDPACRRSTHWQGATQEDRIRAKVENKK